MPKEKSCYLEGDWSKGSRDLQSVGKLYFSLYDRIKIGSETEYVLGLCAADDTVAASLSSNTLKLCKLCNASLTALSTIHAHKDTITGIKFSSENYTLLFTSSKDGTVKAWDTRVPSCNSKPVLVFQDNSNETPKPLNCFDLDPKETFLCGGTDQIEKDAFLIFWDKRAAKVLGGYWNSHTDDITDVCYHPKEKDMLISGSVDGLINIFDVSQSSEDDALLNTINTESSVSKLNWVNENKLSCLTHTEEMQIWDSSDMKLIHSYSRENLTDIVNTSVDYFIDTIKLENKDLDLMLMTGTSSGAIQIWLFEGDDTRLFTVLKGGHHDVVRSKATISSKILTGGEDGVVCLWEKAVSDSGKLISELKQMHVHHQRKPY